MSKSKNTRKGLLLYQDLFEPLLALESAVRGDVIKACLEYNMNPEMEPVIECPAVASAWAFVRPKVVRALKQYNRESAAGRLARETQLAMDGK